MSVDLYLTRLLDTSHPVDLVFATETLVYNGTNIRLSVSLTPPSVQITASAKTIYRASFSIALPPPSTAIALAYDNAVQRGLQASASAGWQPATAKRPQTAMAHRQAENLRAYRPTSWGTAARLRSYRETRWQENTRLHRMAASAWQEASRRAGAPQRTRWQERDRTQRPAASAAWQEASRLSPPGTRTRWQERGRHARPTFKAPWGEGTHRGVELKIVAGEGRPLQISFTAPWQEGRHPPPGRSGFVVPVPPVEEPCYTLPPGGAVPLLFTDLWTGSTWLLFRCGKDRPRALVIVPIKRVYMIVNDSSLHRVEGDIDLPVFGMSLSIDMDSWTWNFSADLPARALGDLQPNGAGDPVELQTLINGTAFRVYCEKISRARTFGKESISISGRGKSALLDSPYSPVMTFGNDADRTAQQLLNQVLTTNGVSIGWSVDWNLIDWLVPAGVWAHQGTYISAANAIAAAAGGYIQPHATGSELIVLPKYPSAPWQWGTLAPDFELPSAVVRQEGVEWIDKAKYNRVFVSGAAGGILGQVTRAGTAGDLVAQMVTDPLITHADAARQRGTAILGDTGRQALVSLSLPVLAETGVITPGKLVRYLDGGVTRLGIVRSTGIAWSSPEVWQTLGIETHVA